MPEHRYHLVDVFTDRAFGGNPLAVFPDAAEVPEALYQAIARELNLSETTFVLPPTRGDCHARVRIFTPGRELPMAGHPTVGTAYVLTRLGRFTPGAADGPLMLEEGVGPVPVDVQQQGDAPGRITMTQPDPDFGASVDDPAVVAEALSLAPGDVGGAPPQVVSCGVPFLCVPLRTRAAVNRARLRLEPWTRHLAPTGAHGVYLFALEPETPAGTVHARMFAPELGVGEDPATGSAAGPLGAYLVRHGLIEAAPEATLVVEQGFAMGRPSFLHVAVRAHGDAVTAVRVGGTCVPVGHGTLVL